MASKAPTSSQTRADRRGAVAGAVSPREDDDVLGGGATPSRVAEMAGGPPASPLLRGSGDLGADMWGCEVGGSPCELGLT